MTPTGHDIAVATGALRAEADTWTAQAGLMDRIAGGARRVGFDRVQAGIFQLIVTAHADLAAAVADRATEGVAAMGQIAATLRQVADTYDDEERRRVHALRHLY